MWNHVQVPAKAICYCLCMQSLHIQKSFREENSMAKVTIFIKKMKNSNAFQCNETVLCQQRLFIKRETNGTWSGNRWPFRLILHFFE